MDGAYYQLHTQQANVQINLATQNWESLLGHVGYELLSIRVRVGYMLAPPCDETSANCHLLHYFCASIFFYMYSLYNRFWEI